MYIFFLPIPTKTLRGPVGKIDHLDTFCGVLRVLICASSLAYVWPGLGLLCLRVFLEYTRAQWRETCKTVCSLKKSSTFVPRKYARLRILMMHSSSLQYLLLYATLSLETITRQHNAEKIKKTTHNSCIYNYQNIMAVCFNACCCIVDILYVHF